VEIVHVKLADETCEVAMLEINWEDFLAELVHRIDDELSAVGVPGYYFRERLVA
jgi:hypothetical protein